MTRKIAIVTTFHKDGYDKYAKRMIQTFLQNWPVEITLYAYAEDCSVLESAPNLVVRDLHASSSELVTFKNTWKDVPKANGKEPIPPIIPNAKKQPGLGFKWDAVRFAHKVYSIFHCAKNCDADILLWMDADTVCHSPITFSEIEAFCPEIIDVGFLGREGKYTECGLYSINLKTDLGQLFLSRFQEFYDTGAIFKLTEWHDSFVFDEVRRSMQLRELNWSRGLIRGEGHPLINSQWGAYLDHLKGDRKSMGRSKAQDLKIKRTEPYWQ